MNRYAQNTLVSVGRSKGEIEDCLYKYGASDRMFGQDGNYAILAFKLNGRMIKLSMPLPDPKAKEFHQTPGGRRQVTLEKSLALWEQGCRQRYRALLLVIKAKFEAVAAGITTFDREFMAGIVLPNGRTVGDELAPQIAANTVNLKLLSFTAAPEEKTCDSHQG